MTTKEKVERLDEFCHKHLHCHDSLTGWECPLYTVYGDCYDENDPESVDRSYKIIFPDDEESKTSSSVNHPSHYCQGGMECIDEMLLIFGVEAVKNFCLLNAWKYRKRALFKNGQEDIEKSDWYIAKYKELIEEERDAALF